MGRERGRVLTLEIVHDRERLDRAVRRVKHIITVLLEDTHQAKSLTLTYRGGRREGRDILR